VPAEQRNSKYLAAFLTVRDCAIRAVDGWSSSLDVSLRGVAAILRGRLSASAQLCADCSAGVVQHIKRRSALRPEPAAIDYGYQAFRGYRRGTDEFAVGCCVQTIRISRQRYSVGAFSSA
jgi:hypothetical protein